MIGREKLVTEQIDNLRGTGEVQVDGQYWMQADSPTVT